MSQDEVDALLGEEERAADAVAPRDFTRPLRFSADDLERLSKQISSCLPAIESAVRAQSDSGFELSLFHVEETTREAFVASLGEDPFFVQSICVDGATGWIQWDPKEARQMIEQNLGCGTPSNTDAPLSGLECSLAGDLVLVVVEGVANELGLTVTPEESYIEQRILQASVDGSPGGDDQRLSITLELRGPSLNSKIYVYLPGTTAAGESTPEMEIPASLPTHLDDVEVPVIAELASIELPLDGVLALEEGDVSTLGPKQGTEARLVVDGRPAGSATWGHDGAQVALRLLDFSIQSTD